MIRAASDSDRDEIAALEERAFARDGWSAPQVQTELGRAGGVAVVARLPSGRFAGYALGWSVAGECELLRIAVEPDLRGTGLGGALLDAFAAAAAARGATTAFLEVRADNVAALGLYETRGFRATGRRRAYYRDGTDAVGMEAPLVPYPSPPNR